MTPHPNALFESAKNGNGNARGRLLESYRGYLKTLVRAEIHRGLASKADPSHLVQEAFLKAHAGFRSFHGSSERELAAWLRAILATSLSKFHRRHSAQKRDYELERRVARYLDESSIFLARDLVQPGPSPSEVVSNRERDKIVADAIENLPEERERQSAVGVLSMRGYRCVPLSRKACARAQASAEQLTQRSSQAG